MPANDATPVLPRWLRLILQIAIWISLFVLLGLSIYRVWLAVVFLEDNRLIFNNTPADQRTPDDFILTRAKEAISSAELILGFIEPASVLVALALGAAALYGVRNADDLRKTIEEKTIALDEAMQEINRLVKQEGLVRRLEQLPDEMERRFKLMQDDFDFALGAVAPVISDLMMANQELNLRNYEEAHKLVLNVLEKQPNNIQALYIAGWLELQYIQNGELLEEGLARLKSALQSEVPSIIAAYGVGLRRKAAKAPQGEQRNRLFLQAEGEILRALGHNPNLVDLNLESFWGPIGGIRRDTGRLDLAIEAYRKALEVTPGSSYPQGNLANLLMQKAKETEDNALLHTSLVAFRETADAARAELAIRPNDYYLLMDMAMSHSVLGYEDEKHFETARRYLGFALAKNPPLELLRVSLRGWERLLAHIPETPDWEAVRDKMQACRQDVSLLHHTKKDDTKSRA
jgi:tetratricopeptide (TPR) repeat protein